MNDLFRIPTTEREWFKIMLWPGPIPGMKQVFISVYGCIGLSLFGAYLIGVVGTDAALWITFQVARLAIYLLLLINVIEVVKLTLSILGQLVTMFMLSMRGEIDIIMSAEKHEESVFRRGRKVRTIIQK